MKIPIYLTMQNVCRNNERWRKIIINLFSVKYFHYAKNIFIVYPPLKEVIGTIKSKLVQIGTELHKNNASFL
jgi:hypothetical protein